MTSETKPEELLETEQIAAKLKIDPKTLRKHLRAISGKASGERYAWKPTISLGRNRRRQRQPLRHHRNRWHIQLRHRLRNHTLAFVLSSGLRRFAPLNTFSQPPCEKRRLDSQFGNQFCGRPLSS
jgi:hypothetical protein